MLVRFYMLSLIFLSVSGSKENEVTINYNYDVSDVEIVDKSRLIKPLILKSTTTPIPPMSGPLYNFIVNLFTVILDHHFTTSRLHKYVRVLSKSLKGLGTGYLMKIMIKRLAKLLHKMSSKLYSIRYIKSKLTNLKTLLTEVKPKKMDLFKELNSMYTVAQDVKMDTYLYRLKKYGSRKRQHIGRLTRDILEKLIFYTIKRQNDGRKNDIQLKFALAALEYYEKPLII